MRKSQVSVIMVAGDPNGVAESQTPGAAGDLTLNGALVTGGVATFDIARHIELASTGIDTARVFTITGTNRYGDAITETITGLNVSTVKGIKNFKTVTQIAVDAATAGAITAGSSDEAESKWWPTERHMADFNIGLGVRLVNSGALTFQVQHATEDPQVIDTAQTGVPEDDMTAFDHPSATGTANTDGNYAYGVGAIRIKVTGHTAGGVVMDINQSGY